MASLEVYVSGQYDHATESGGGTYFETNGDTYGMWVWLYKYPDSGSDSYRCGGWRFQVNIPQGATINSAYLDVWPDGGNDDPSFTIYAHDVDNAPDFNDNANIIDTEQRPRTTAGVLWEATGVGEDQYVTSPDIKTVIQEIVDRGSWAANNYLVLLGIADVGTADHYFSVRTYDWSPSKPAKLTIDYTAAPVSKSSSDTGTGAEAITSALATLTNAETGSGAEAFSGTATLANAEAGTGAEAFLMAATLAGSETASGVEEAGIFLTVAETGSGTDALSALLAILIATETASGTDAFSYSTPIHPATVSDAGIATEALGDRIIVLQTETASGTDAISSLLALLTDSDTGSGTDLIYDLVRSWGAKVIKTHTGLRTLGTHGARTLSTHSNLRDITG